MKIVVNGDNIRIDKYLSENTEYSRSYIEKLINDKYILVNGKEVKASYKVCLNDEIEINDTLKKESDIQFINTDIPVSFKQRNTTFEVKVEMARGGYILICKEVK